MLFRSHNGKSDSQPITVYTTPTSMTITPATFTLSQEQQQTVMGAVNEGSYGEIYYKTSNASVATVDANGVVTGVGKGECRITAYTYVEGVEASATVTVIPAPTSVTLPEKATIGAYDSTLAVPLWSLAFVYTPRLLFPHSFLLQGLPLRPEL